VNRTSQRGVRTLWRMAGRVKDEDKGRPGFRNLKAEGEKGFYRRDAEDAEGDCSFTFR